MKMIKCLIFSLLLSLGATGLHAQLVKVKSNDSICGHKLIKDKDGRALSWYKPEVPGAGYNHVARLASEFLKNSCPIDSKTGLPMYLVTCCFQGPHMTKDKNFVAEEWPHNPACFYAGCVQGLAVEYRAYTGDDGYIQLVQGMLDYQLENGTTPEGWQWEKVPYASSDPLVKTYQGATRWEAESNRGDGLHCIEPDKIGELGYGYLRFYEITGNDKYLQAAMNCADALAKHIRDTRNENSAFIQASTKKSPWPFRVNARTGVVIDEYCSNAIDPVKLFDELLRIGKKINLSQEKSISYKKTRDLAWEWLFSRNGPMITFIWNAYFEDIYNDPERTNRLQITPMEMAKYLILHPELDKNLDKDVSSLIYWVSNAFKTDGMDAIKEQTWCYEPMGSHTARYGSVCAMWYEKTGNSYFKDQAYRFLNFATYMTYDNGVVAVGPNWPGSWFSDGYSDYIRHYLDAMAAVPEWAPANENHLLRSSSVVQTISYNTNEISFTTYDDSSRIVLKLNKKPKSILINSHPLNIAGNAQAEGWYWSSLSTGGVVKINVLSGNKYKIQF